MTEIKQSQQQLYKIINDFVEPRRIELRQFWFSQRICVPMETFVQMASAIGVNIGNQLSQQLQSDEVDLISLENLIDKVQYWRYRQINIATYLSKNSPIKRQKKQYQSSHSNSQLNKSSVSSKSNLVNKKYLNQHARKKIQDEAKLNFTLKNVKNESQYSLSIKIGELNDICTKLKNHTSFSLETKKDGKIAILMIEKGKTQEKISQKKFQTKYEEIKLQFMSHYEAETQENLQEDLKKVLVEVMCLSSQMKKQIKLLERKGVQH